MMRRSGFTLIELLVGVVIFSALAATLLSVISAMRRAEKFRDEQSLLPRVAHFALEPVTRAVRSSDAAEQLRIDGTCQTVRGYYGTRAAGNTVVYTPSEGDSTRADVLVTLHREPTPESLVPYQWVRKTYAVETAQNGPQLTERVAIIPSGTPHAWPAPINRCNGENFWQEVPDRTKILTDVQTNVVTFGLSLQSPLEGATQVRSPFVRVQLVLANPRTDKQLGVQTTVTPGFSYGEVRDAGN